MEIDKKTVSYCLGMHVAYSLAEQFSNDLSVEDLSRAISDVFNQKTTDYSPEEANNKITEYIKVLNESKFGMNKVKGQDFLVENAKKASVTTTSSGLQYEVIQEGDGTRPVLNSQVTVHYHGTLIDGTVFDSSIQRGSPATFGLTQVIKGWTEALQLMKKGSKYRLYIPQELAYGSSSPSAKIAPYSTLIFEVELLDFH